MNPFVDFINQFYSQNITQNAGYTELSEKKLEGIQLKVSRLIDDIAQGKVKVAILTGNAGDGKTFLCRQIFQELTGKPFSNKPIVESTFKDQKIIILKDASEVPKDELIPILKRLENNIKQKAKGRVIYILAGNEGKLSEIFLDEFPKLMEILNSSLDSIYDDDLEKDKLKLPNVEVINFNWRSLTEETVFTSILNAFLRDGEWEEGCCECPLAKDLNCPIRFNVQSLKEPVTRERTRLLFQFFYYMEGHFSLRELLSALSYIITGNLTCRRVKEMIAPDDPTNSPLGYVFYNNIFSQHNIGTESPIIQKDRILKNFLKYDVVVAPLVQVNQRAMAIVDTEGGVKAVKNQADLDNWLKAAGELIKKTGANKENKDNKDSDGSEPSKLPLYNSMKRRMFFISNEDCWPADDDILTKKGDILPTYYFPYPGFIDYHRYIAGSTGEERSDDEFKEFIIMGLNLMANRNDTTPGWGLKVHKLYRNNRPINLEIIGDHIESLDISMSREEPLLKSSYLEWEPRTGALTVKLTGQEKEPIRLPLDIRMFESLRSAALGDQSKQQLGELARVIDDFREVLFYRLLKSNTHAASSKFLVNHLEKFQSFQVTELKTQLRIQGVKK